MPATHTTAPEPTAAEDLAAVARTLPDGRPPDPVLVARVRDRAARIRDGVRRTHGNVANALLREARDEA